jgi:hypothetical protein
VAAERDATRGIFHRAYSLLRIAKPVSASMGAVAGKVSDAAYRVLQLLRKDDRA